MGTNLRLLMGNFFLFWEKEGSEGNSFTFYDWELEFGNFQELVGVRVTV